MNLVLTLCDAGDSVVMFAPYYFNAYMSFQMTGVTDILVGDCHPKTLHPDVGQITFFFFLCIEKFVRCLISAVYYKKFVVLSAGSGASAALACVKFLLQVYIIF